MSAAKGVRVCGKGVRGLCSGLREDGRRGGFAASSPKTARHGPRVDAGSHRRGAAIVTARRVDDDSAVPIGSLSGASNRRMSEFWDGPNFGLPLGGAKGESCVVVIRRVGKKVGWQLRALAIIGDVANSAGHPGATAVTCIGAFPWSGGMVLANPAGALADGARRYLTHRSTSCTAILRPVSQQIDAPGALRSPA